MDLSGSIGTQLPNAKAAVDSFVDALIGTPSRVALFSFDLTSPGSGGRNYPDLRSVRTRADATTVRDLYKNWNTGSGTNWDAGLYRVATVSQASQYDVVIVLTDGNPTSFGTGSAPNQHGSNRLRDIEAGIFSANLIKANGTRVVTVGVGRGAEGISNLNLQAISGPVLGKDYFQVGSYDLAARTLAQLAKGNCEGSIDVVKRVIPASASIPTNPTNDQLLRISAPAEGWQINGLSATDGATFGSPAGPWTTAADGQVTIPVGFSAPSTTGDVTWSETQRTGYALQPLGSGTAARNAYCVNADTRAAVSVSNSGATGVTVPVAVNTAIECTIYNREVPGVLTTAKTSSPASGAALARGSSAIVTLSFGNTGGQPVTVNHDDILTDVLDDADVTNIQTSNAALTAVRSGNRIDIAGTVPAGATYTVTYTVTVPNTPKVGGNGVVNNYLVAEGVTPPATCPTTGAGANQCTTHPIPPRLTLAKAVSSGSEPRTSWTLRAQAPAGAIAGPAGVHGSTAATAVTVTPNVAYALRESGGPATYTQVGAWVCATSTGTPATLTGANVRLAAGQDVTCTVTNATATVTLLKQVVNPAAGVASNDWNLTATPATLTGLVPLTRPGADFAAGGNAASTIEVRPGHAYTLSETPTDPAAPLAYRLARLELRQANGTWTPVANATITAPAAGQNAVYRFVNEPIPAVSLPLTGGASTDSYFIAGGGVLLLAMITSAWAWRRRRRFA